MTANMGKHDPEKQSEAIKAYAKVRKLSLGEAVRELNCLDFNHGNDLQEVYNQGYADGVMMERRKIPNIILD